MRRLIALLIAASPAIAQADDALPGGLAVGVEVGEPTSATVRWAALDGRLGIGAAFGTGTLAGVGVSAHADLGYAVVVLRSGQLRIPIQLGVGVRHYRHGYAPASIDELPDAHTGIRGSLSIAVVLPSALEVYAEAAPGYDLHRTGSCTFMSGVDTICPHAQDGAGFVQIVAGVRLYLTR